MFRMVLILLTLLLPWGRPSEFRKYREREKLSQELQREVERIDQLRRARSYPYFQLDVF